MNFRGGMSGPARLSVLQDDVPLNMLSFLFLEHPRTTLLEAAVESASFVKPCSTSLHPFSLGKELCFSLAFALSSSFLPSLLFSVSLSFPPSLSVCN